MFRNFIDEIMGDDEKKGCFLINTTTELAATDPEVAKTVKWSQDQLDDCFSDAIKQAIDSGDLSSDLEPRSLALFISNTMKGLRVMAKSKTVREDVEAVVNTALKVLG
jgi:TetR/AcrR family transcriptional repressor of nem operon